MSIYKVAIEEEVKQSYIDYAMSVIVGRAIPDIRDGLKPVQRRVLFSMHEMGLFPEKPFVKSARIVGTVLGYYHPHGDQAAYETLVRMAQDFVMNYPLVTGQGNFGSIDGDPPAAMRYTEAKLSKFAMLMLEDIQNDTVDFLPNFDGTVMEPSILPSRFPNLICNGASGIAVGLTTSIPPHNLKEVCEALISLAKDPSLDLEKILELIPGPDFPTGAIIENPEELREIYEKGKGQIRLRAKAHVEKLQGGREQIVFSDIPYQVNKAETIKRIAELIKEGKLKEVASVRDESDKEGIRITLELKRDVESQKVLEKVYKLTQLRKNFMVNMVVLIDGEPKQVGLKEILQKFIEHRLEVILRRSKYFLNKTRERLEIVKGLVVALENIDDIIKILKTSKDAQSAKESLEKGFNLNSKQSQAILDMRLQRLTSMEREKLIKEQEELTKKAEDYLKLVQSQEERIRVFIEEIKELASFFKTPRKTTIEGKTPESAGSLSVVIYEHGEVSPLEKFDGADMTVNILEVPYSDGLFMVSDMGRVYWVAGKQALKGSKIRLKEAKERIVGAFTRSGAHDRIILASKLGFIKKVPLADFEYRSQGMQIFGLSENDAVVCVLEAQEEKQVVLFTCSGKAVRFSVSEVPPSTVGKKPLQGIKLDSDEICGMRLVEESDRLLVVTKRGISGFIKASEIPLKQKGQRGTSIGSGELVDLLPFRENIQIMVVSDSARVFYKKLSEKDIKIDDNWSLEDDFIRRVVIIG